MLNQTAFPFWPIGDHGERVSIDWIDEHGCNGTRFTCLDYRTGVHATTLSSIALTTDATTETIMTVSLETTKAGVWRFSEGATVSGGSVLSVFNNNRVLGNGHSCVISGNVVVTTVGTVIGYHVIGSSTGGASKSGGASAERNPWTLKPSTTYLLTFQPTADDCAVVQGIFFVEREV